MFLYNILPNIQYVFAFLYNIEAFVYSLCMLKYKVVKHAKGCSIFCHMDILYFHSANSLNFGANTVGYQG